MVTPWQVTCPCSPTAQLRSANVHVPPVPVYWQLTLPDSQSAEALQDLTFDTPEPEDAQVERLPRSVFWQD